MILVAALAFISFLYLSSEGNSSWQRIMVNGWATRSITLTSVALRLAAVAQAGLCTCILAALALEQYDVTLPHTAAVSTLRITESGPHNLLLVLFRCLGKGRTSAFTLIALLTITTILSQIFL